MEPCRDIELELAAYCSGELGPAARDRVRNHLNGCARCRAELRRETSLRDALGSLPRVCASADLTDRIQAAVQPAGTPPGHLGGKARRTAGAVLVAAVLAVAVLLPGGLPVSGPDQAWTQEELDIARQEVKYTLALTAKVIDRTQKEAVVDVFADRLPSAINESLKMFRQTTSGGNG